MSILHEPITVGELRLPNRIIMAPLTRNRATMPGRVPNALMARLLRAARLRRPDPHRGDLGDADGRRLSEHARHLVAGAGARAGRAITKAVHAAGGRILLQLWHVGRISALRCISTARCRWRRAPSRPQGPRQPGAPAERAYATPRALETERDSGIVEAYRRGAENAKAAGFDGVEIHGANGYLLDQFLQDGTQQAHRRLRRPIENRARLMLEVTDAVISVWGAGRVGMHLAPRADSHDMGDSDRPATFGYVARELGKRAHRLHLRPRGAGRGPARARSSSRRSAASTSPTSASSRRRAEAVIAAGRGRCGRVRQGLHRQSRPAAAARAGAPLNPWNAATFYTEGPAGYTDYPAIA